MTAAPDQIADFAGSLAAGGGLKLWSVIVTMLGDRFQNGGDATPGTVLSACIERIGLQPQAMRVALHRLKRDGWVESRRKSRIGYYSLSATGQAQTRSVSPRVYGIGPPLGSPLWLLVAPPTGWDPGIAIEGPVTEVLQLARRTALALGRPIDAGTDALAGCLAAPLPGWALETCREAACDRGFQKLRRALASLEPAAVVDPVDVLALRTLTLHAWRRLVLKSHPVAEVALGPAAAIAGCRSVTLALLEALPLPDLALLQQRC